MKKEVASLKEEIKSKSHEKRELTLKILALKWGTLANALAVRELKKDKGTRAQRKALRHPETGQERSMIWVDKRDLKERLRYLYLAYAFVRGRSYRQQEPKCASAPDAGSILYTIEAAGGKATLEEVQAWLAVTPAEVAAA